MSLAAINKVKSLKKEKQRRKSKKKKNIDLSKYSRRPIEFLKEILGIKLLSKEQEEIALSILNNQTTNVQAAHGVGKSFLMACLIIWYVFAVEGMAVSTAPTFNQVNDILWKEVRNIYDRNKRKLGGRRNELSIRKTTKEGKIVTGFGKSTKDNSSASFQGLHEENLLLIQDEADGISDIIDEAFESCLTGSKNRGVRIGNPLNSGSAFAKNCGISNIKITVWEHPNVSWAYREVVTSNGKTIHRLKPEVAAKILKPEHLRKDDPVLPQEEWAEDLPRDVIPGAVSIAWIEKVRVKYGEFSSYWMSRVEAEFPGDDVDGIIPKSWLKEARARYDANPDYWDNLAKLDRWRIGVDVADGGDDNHAVAAWRGPVLYKVDKHTPKGDREDTVRLAQDIVEPLVNQLGANYAIAVDRLGVGAGTLGTLKRDGYYAVSCAFGESAQDKTQFKDRKIELYWGLREGLRLGEIAIAPLGDIEEEVFEDLSAVRYESNTDKQIYCEPKAKTKKRLKRSPDAGDAVIIAGEFSYTKVVGTQTVRDDGLGLEERQIKAAIELAESRSYGDVSYEEVRSLFD